MAEINGRTYDFSDVQLKVGGDAPVNIELLAVSYKLNREVGKMFGNSPQKVYRTRGRVDPDGEFRVPLHRRDELLTALAAISETGAFGDAQFEISVSYGTDNQPVITDTLEKCVLMDVDGSAEEGTDGLEVTLPIDISAIDFNGLRCFNDPTA